jgi:L-ascorbate metabolism protein UlaG (beta-lactamase superfamily)
MQKTHKIQPYIYKGRFYNYKGETKSSVLWPSLVMIIENLCTKSHDTMLLQQWIEYSDLVHRVPNAAITWIGHATFLIQIGTINILTDPVFENLSLLYPRILPAGIMLPVMPPIDFVLISHNHRDHMDAPTLEALKKHEKAIFLVPHGDKQWFDKRGFERVIESTWWDRQTYTITGGDSDTIEFTFLPAFHWSQRGLFDYNKSLWGSWMISYNNKTIYFAGDTGYSDHFKCISKEFNDIDIALMPIGPCEPRHIMRNSHMNAEEAGQAFLDLHAKRFIPMHWGTYLFGTDTFLEPIERITNWWKSTVLQEDKFLHITKIGKRLYFD